MKKTATIFIKFCFLIMLPSLLAAQGRPYEGPDDPAGDKAAIREGYMTGNRVFLYFQNTTELSYWVQNLVDPLYSRWPNNADGVRMLDGVALLIGAKVYIKDGTTPVPNEADRTSGKIDTLYYLQTSYREEMDENSIGTVRWGLYPVFGYFNAAGDYPAMSNLSGSWPPGGWPTGEGLQYPGLWNGRFGWGIIYADLETYFVANDAQDQEAFHKYKVPYYPRPGVKIGDKNSNVSIQYGEPWGGIGIRVQVRGFQWNNPQARDALFWEYSIANISDYDLPEVAFGYWVDNGIGGDTDDDLGFFDRTIDMAYSWDYDGVGHGGLPTGDMGFAYLESPGLPYDGIDNDEDGLTDEKRDNQATTLVGPYDGITNLSNFLRAYNLKESDLREHWDADEDQDWQDGVDANGDNAYAQQNDDGSWSLQTGEEPNDDVGTDGISPLELNYPGPDKNGTEGNHKPDYDPVTGKSEPNFAVTDVTESDMVGLTSFRLFRIPAHTTDTDLFWFHNDQAMWALLGQDSTLEYLGNISNLVETFASGPFPLYQGQEERISMSELHAYDELNGLNSSKHSAPVLYEQKRIVQVIYESDYRFAQPPKTPTLTATAEDGKVVLTWDDIADTKTRDPFLKNINDFEGYKLYRATDKQFSDAEIITDGNGTKSIKKPIFLCDLIDGKRGFTDFGLVNGASYNLGYDTGIVHHFVDGTVQNGRTYYYALVSYDYGAPDIGTGIAPSESPIILDLDEQDNIRSYGINVAIVVPHQDALGYNPPSSSEINYNGILGKGTIEPEVLASNSIKTGHTYKVKFGVDTVKTKAKNITSYKIVKNANNALLYTTNSLYVYDMSAGGKLVYSETPGSFAYENVQTIEDVQLNASAGTTDTLRYTTLQTGSTFNTDVFDGLRLNITLPYETASYDYDSSGWVVGNAPMNVTPVISDPLRESLNYFPWDYEIIFTNNDSAYVSKVTSRTRIRDENDKALSSRNIFFGMNYNFYVQNVSFKDSTGEYPKLEMVAVDADENGSFELLKDKILVGPVDNNDSWTNTIFAIDFHAIADSSGLPRPNDVYRITYNRPFYKTDSLMFTISNDDTLDVAMLKSSMDNIKVVPNPYVGTNTMEEAVINTRLNQPRRLAFTHIPAQCTIKIFTVSGLLVDKIDVNNPADDGIVHWDMLTNEGLEIAAGIYLYQVKASKTGDTHLGKFAVIK